MDCGEVSFLKLRILHQKKRPEGRIVLLFVHDFSFCAVNFAQSSVEMVFGRIDNDVVRTGIGFKVSAEA